MLPNTNLNRHVGIRAFKATKFSMNRKIGCRLTSSVKANPRNSYRIDWEVIHFWYSHFWDSSSSHLKKFRWVVCLKNELTKYLFWPMKGIDCSIFFQIPTFQKQVPSGGNPPQVTKIAATHIAAVRVGGEKPNSHQTGRIRIRVWKTTSSAFASTALGDRRTKMVQPRQGHLGLLIKCLSYGHRYSLQYSTFNKLHKTFSKRYYYGVYCIVYGRCIGSFLKYEHILSVVSWFLCVGWDTSAWGKRWFTEKPSIREGLFVLSSPIAQWAV